MDTTIDSIKKQFTDSVKNFSPKTSVENFGTIVEVGDSIAKVNGLSEAQAGELLSFPYGITGIALNLEKDSVGAIIVGDYTKLKEGDIVRTTGRIAEVPVGEELIGRVINAIGEPIDGKAPLQTKEFYPLEKIAPGVIRRKGVDTPLQTGIIAIDALIPIGRGQRELIIGDRQTGKSAIAIDTIINQKGKNCVCIYVAIGQKRSKVAQVVATLEKYGAMDHTIVINASAAEPAALQYIAPYTGTAIGEWFMDQGRDALIVFDDLTKHAQSYREISLLLRRPPGREAFPGDVFYLHSRLLERAAKVSAEYGGGSLTALPVIETQAGDVSAYIPTNVISITDGQIFLESDLFYKGIRPALNIGISVSRVGSAAQIKAMKKVAGKLRLEMAQFRDLEAFSQFGSELDDATKNTLERGKRLNEILKQAQYAPYDVVYQVIFIYSATRGFLDTVPVDQIATFKEQVVSYLDSQAKSLLEQIRQEKDITPAIDTELKATLQKFISGFVSSN